MIDEYNKIICFKYCVNVFREYRIYDNYKNQFNDTIFAFTNLTYTERGDSNNKILCRIVKHMVCHPSLHNNRWIKRQMKNIKKDYKFVF